VPAFDVTDRKNFDFEEICNMAKILVADDEADVVEYVTDLLEFAGWETGGATDGVDAVIKALDEPWDVLLMDIRMPKLDGIGALKIIKHFNPSLPVVMFTGQAGQGDMFESTRLGAFVCLLKPVSSQKLLQAVEQAVAHGVHRV
jgi:two-component system response regulator HydG